MATDPAFPYYYRDAASDVTHMTRLARGGYFDLVQAQKKFHGYTAEDIRNILGKDYDEIWPAIKVSLKVDDQNLYYIEWVREAIENRAKHAEKQRERINKRWAKKEVETIIPDEYHGITTVIPKIEEVKVKEEVKEEEIKGGTGGKKENQPENDFINRIIQVFMDQYAYVRGIDYVQISKGKDRLAAGRLAGIYRKKFPDKNTDEILEMLAVDFRAFNCVKNDWLRDNISLSLIVSKFNEYVQAAKKVNGMAQLDEANRVFKERYGENLVNL